VTDRGMYRPGSSIAIKATVLAPAGSGLGPLAAANLAVRVVSSTEKEACSLTGTSNDMGSVALECKLAANAETGLYTIHLATGAEIAHTTVRVAAFEAPRF